MTKRTVAREVKGTLVAAAAAWSCYAMWAHLVEWARDASIAGQGAMGAGWTEGLLAGIVGLLSMPALLWAGMRLLGERGNHLLVVGGLFVWWFIGGHAVEGRVGAPDNVLYLALFTAICGLLSLAEVSRT